MVKKELVTLPQFETGLGGRAWSPGLKVGPWLFVSGVTPVDYDKGENVGRGPSSHTTPGRIDPEAQWHQVLSNIKRILEAGGATMADVVLANVYVTDMHFYYQYQHIRKEYFVEPYPVCTAIEVGSLVHPDWILEVEVQAYVGE